MRPLLLALLLVLAAPPNAERAVAADLRAGLAAFAQGDHATARRELEPLAQGGDAQAQFMLGVMHETGAGLPQDFAAAAEWYRRAAEKGEAAAQFNLGLYSELGRLGPADPKVAAAWYRLAAEQGHGPAQNNLGSLYYLGKGVSRDLVEAYKWKALAADSLTDERRAAAVEDREKIARELSSADLDRATRQVTDWQPIR